MSSTSLLSKKGRHKKHNRTFGATYSHVDGGTVTLNLPDPDERDRTVSSVAPLPESCYTINLFLFFLTCFQLINLLVLTYTDSVLNYIAKRFYIPNTMASFIPSSYQIGNLIVIIPVSYYGNTLNRPKAIGVGVMIMIIGLAFCVLPHFIMPYPRAPLNSTLAPLCYDDNVSTSAQELEEIKQHRSTLLEMPDNLPCNLNSSLYNPALLVIIGHTLFGGGAAPLWPLGVSYIDDHVILRKAPVYIGIFIGSTLMGPVFGFLLGSVTSAISFDMHKGEQLNQSDPAYIGAWWLGYAISCAVLALLLFPFYFYPRSLPVSPQKQEELAQMEVLQKAQRKFQSQPTEGNSSISEPVEPASSSEESSAASCGGTEHLQRCKKSPCVIIAMKLTELACAIQRTLFKPMVLTPVIAFSALSLMLSGVAAFGSTYVQRVFNVLRTTSDMLIGGVSVPFGILGAFLGGYLMKRYNFDIRQTLICAIAFSGVGCIFFSFLFGFGCDMQEIAGLTIPYKHSKVKSIISSCNDNCMCPRGQLDLICGSDGTTYLSACYAGCKVELNNQQSIFKETKMYKNCSCVEEGDRSSKIGPCSDHQCAVMLGLFILFASLAILFLCLCQAPIYAALLRSLETQDKALGIGLMAFMSRLLGAIPGPIVFGLILDRSCIYWSAKCMGKQVCLLYNTFGLRFSFIGICLGFGTLYCLCFLLSFVWMEFHKQYYEKSVGLLDQDVLSTNYDKHQETSRTTSSVND